MATVLKYTDAQKMVTDIFLKAGYSEEYAPLVADNLIQAELRGVRSHGLVQVKPYVERFLAGRICNARPELVQESAATAVVDGHFAPGVVSGTYGMNLAIQKAKESGIGVAVVRNGTHFGMAYYYAQMALEQDMIGMAFTNAGAIVAPYGGIQRELGTNPICVAVPADRHAPIVFDAATSEAAFNKLFFAATEHRQIPKGWAMDENGEDTENPAEGMKGALYPFGGYKGYGLAVIVNILTGLLSGASLGHDGSGKIQENIDNVGYHFVALDISKFQDIDTFKQLVDLFADRLKASEKKKGVQEILLPGEPELRNAQKAREEGLLLYDGVYGNLIELQKKN